MEMSTSSEDLCLLCVNNLAASTEVDLEKQRPAAELLQQIFIYYQIKVGIKDSMGRICDHCMTEVLQMCDILRSWHEAQGRLQSQETGISDDEDEEEEIGNDDEDIEDDEREGEDEGAEAEATAEVEEQQQEDDEEQDDDDEEDNVVDIESVDWGDHIESDYEALDDLLSEEFDELPETNNDHHISVSQMPIDALVLTSNGGILGKLVRDRTEMYCYYCHKMFQGGSKLRHHSILEHPQLLYTCFECGTTFSNPEQLQNHKEQKQHQQQHQQQQQQQQQQQHGDSESHSQMLHYRCHKCGRIFDRVFSVIRHERDVHKQSHYQCTNSNCRRIFETKRGYSIHMKKHENVLNDMIPIIKTEIKQEIKQEIEEELEIEQDIKQEMKIDVKEPYQCGGFICPIKHCRKSFQTRAQLAYHKITHSGEEFYCIICSRRLSSRSNMRRHIRTVHNPLQQDQKKRRRQDVKRELDGIGDDDDIFLDLVKQQKQMGNDLKMSFDHSSSSSGSTSVSNFIVIGKTPSQTLNMKVPYPSKPQGGHFISLK